MDKQELGYTDAVYHRLRITNNIPVAQPYRRIPPHLLKEVQEHIKGLLSQKPIVESHSPYTAPVVIVHKKDGSIWLCVDRRRLSAKTVGDAYLLPRIQEFFDALVGAQYFFHSGPGLWLLNKTKIKTRAHTSSSSSSSSLSSSSSSSLSIP